MSFTSFIITKFQEGPRNQLWFHMPDGWLWYYLVAKNILKVFKLYQLINNILSATLFQTVICCVQISRVIHLQNGLPQGSILASVLLYIYTTGMPENIIQKFTYNGDLEIKRKSLDFTEKILSSDIQCFGKY